MKKSAMEFRQCCNIKSDFALRCSKYAIPITLHHHCDLSRFFTFSFIFHGHLL
ncbi:hypothetical protein B4168_2560 [Anoxybacillus flavithermus]|nr:hypothetical protein B4168_2560 [Anoxybacillus flavithermus]OAO85220.1 hypothetical protein GT23_2911 [Parageobacillus thermoglucosidasius]